MNTHNHHTNTNINLCDTLGERTLASVRDHPGTLRILEVKEKTPVLNHWIGFTIDGGLPVVTKILF